MTTKDARQAVESWMTESISRTIYAAPEVRNRLLDVWAMLAEEEVPVG